MNLQKPFSRLAAGALFAAGARLAAGGRLAAGARSTTILSEGQVLFGANITDLTIH